MLTMAALCCALACNGPAAKPEEKMPEGRAPWLAQSNIYEVNLRQYSPEGSFNAFTAQLPRLKEMGVEILWFMPVTPIGVEGRKMNPGDLGSYYAVKDYKAVSPEFGTENDWKNLVEKAHEAGFKVIVDWVANHTAPDHPWIKAHPDFYMRDSAGTILPPNADWTDTRELNYENPVLRDSMIAAMNWWLATYKIDGFRCDIAEEVPVDFWAQAIPELRKTKQIFMLAEGEKPALHEAGFDATYTWSVFHVLNDIAAGKKNTVFLDSILLDNQSRFPPDALRMYFTSNHDENSWNGTEFERMGAGAETFAVFTQTMDKSLPLIYSGQESANAKRLKFFTRDPIQWGTYEKAPFYKKLLSLRKSNPVFDEGATFSRIASSNPSIFAFVRENKKDKLVVILNFTGENQAFTWDDSSLTGKFTDVFSATGYELNPGTALNLAGWQYLVLENK